MEKPVLVVLAAGLGSRYGGLKQMDPVGGHGQSIIDYSLFDARRAGFERVIFVITKELEADFRETVGARASRADSAKPACHRAPELPLSLPPPHLEDRYMPLAPGF